MLKSLLRVALTPLSVLLVLSSRLWAADAAWIDIPMATWKGNVKAEVPALKRSAAAAVALPVKDATPLICSTAEALPAGVYEVRLTLRPSHVAGQVAFASGVKVNAGSAELVDLVGSHFARVHEAETRTFKVVNPKAGPLSIGLKAYADPGAVDQARTSASLKKGGPQLGDDIGDVGGDKGDDLDVELELTLSPDRAVYYLVDKAEFRPLSHSGQVAKVDVNKIRYNPGETLKGSVTVADVGGKGGDGTLTLYLEHGLKDRTKVKALPVKLAREPQTLSVEIPLPTEELGYALVAEYAGADGADRNEASEYFTIASNYTRVAVSGWIKENRDEAAMRKAVDACKAGYMNMSEFFAWAEEDMVEMSPETDYWFSGQTCYYKSKAGMQKLSQLAHEKGISLVSYGKFIMSGYIGWRTAYDYPNDHKGQYFYPVGMWEGVNTIALDRFRNKEFAIYEHSPHVTGNPFTPWWQDFLPINPDATPRMTRVAAEETVRSIEMFGWDGIRWDGHMRGGGQCGGDGQYDAAAARRTQALVRYYKDIVNAKYPAFGHGYNYFMIQKEPGYAWAYEDYELDELCRGGGLLMNESIGNATDGPYDYIVKNLQVEGDLCRERGGHFLGISYAQGPRDYLVEAALWAAAGARTYGCRFMEHGRYYTRYAQYTLDERLRRLVTPEKVLTPTAETRLWWQPFVYETPIENGKRQMIVNFLNIPRQERRSPEGGPYKYVMEPGTDPVSFSLSLPTGIKATGVSLLNPWTLEVTPVPLKDNRFDVPAVAFWLVGIVDLAVDANTPSLASLYGPPKTFGVPRADTKKEDRKAEMMLDPKKEVWEVNKDMSELIPDWMKKRDADLTTIDSLPWDERNARILKTRDDNPADKFLKGWWKGGSLPHDTALADKKIDFGNLAPRRNGRADIYYGRGAMDYRLRMPAAFAGLDRFYAYDAPLMGGLRQTPGMWLHNGIDWRRYPDFDVLLFTGIPHCAMGAENCYAMVNYVKDGGGIFLTGGEYAFGKGGYNFTVLERELLPVICVENVDTRYVESPLFFEPGKDFSDLKATLDFKAKPSFWVWNQVALKSDVKVFLKSGNRPILVGWQLGKGRVACLLVDHRGKSEKDVTAFFDWKDWPALVDAVVAWVAPDAGKTETVPPAVSAAEATKLLQQLEGDSMEDVLKNLEKGSGDTGDLGGESAAPSGTSREIKGDVLKKRVEIIGRALQASGADVATALGEQLVAVNNLPPDTRFGILDFIQRAAPPSIADMGRKCLASQDSIVRGSGYSLLAMAGDPGFAKQVLSPPSATETDPQGRLRDLGLAIALYGKADLADEGRQRVAMWNDQEQKTKMAYTRGKEFSLEAPEVPCLDAEALFQRTAWLAYLSRHDANAYGAEFARQWLMIGQFEDYCDRSIKGLYGDNMSAADIKRAAMRSQDWRKLRTCFTRLRDLTQPDIETLVKTSPDLAGEGFAQARFTPEFRGCMNLLGNLDRKATAPILEQLKKARNRDLTEFAAARAAVKDKP